jgi:plastocyanin
MLKYPAIVLTTTAVALAVAACGSSKSSSTNSTAPFATSSASSAPAATTSAASSAATSSPASSTATTSAAGASKSLAIGANKTGLLKFTTNALAAKAGKVTVAFTNDSPLQHNFTLQEGTNGKVLGATPTFQGGTKTLTLTLKPGTYTFYCSVPGHRMAGMQGTLTVS